MKKFILKILKAFKYAFSLIFYLCPIKKNKITFDNFAGKGYGCNPKYLAEEFIKDNKYQLIWFVKDLNTQMPEHIKKVKYGSLKHYYHLITARLWIDNIRNSLKPPFKRKKQFYLQTWHGRSPLKGIEKDVESLLNPKYVKRAKKDGKLANFILSGSEQQTKIIERAFWFNGEIIKLGLPRDDIFFENTSKEIEKIKKQYNLQDKKIILYAPSFRKDKDFYKNINFDANKIVEAFNNRFGKEHVLCIRLHPNDLKEENIKIFNNTIDLSYAPDSQIVLKCADYVISDYSSMLFDGAMINKKGFTFAPDYESYLKNERSLYLDLTKMPFPFSQNIEELAKNIETFNKEKYIKDLNLYIQSCGFYDNYNSAKKIKEYLQHIKII